jgi:hypothetical protein
MCDCRQFSYVGYENKDTPYKYTSQVGVILKREYPTVLVEDRDENGALIRKRAAQEWVDYFFLDPTNQTGVSSVDRVLSEFWVRNTLFFKLGVQGA